MKKSKLAKLIGVFIALLMVATVAMATACAATPLTALTIVRPDGTTTGIVDLVLGRDANAQLGISMTPDDAVGHNFTWESANPAIASVDANGLVTPNAVGTTQITLTATRTDPVIAAFAQVRVIAAETGIDISATEGQTWFEGTNLATGNFVQRAGPLRQFTFTSVTSPPGALPTGTANREHRTWSTSNPNVATVTVADTGLGLATVNLVGAGNARITVTTNISNHSDYIDFEVLPTQAGAISTLDEFFAMNSNLGGSFFLENDLDFAGVDWVWSGAQSNLIGRPAGAFTGTFDGRGFSLNNIYMSAGYGTNVWGVALFGNTSGATLRNFSMLDATVYSVGGNSAALIGEGINTTVENVFIEASAIWGYALKEFSTDSGGALAGSFSGTLNNVVLDVASAHPLFGNIVGTIGTGGAHGSTTMTNVFTVGDPHVTSETSTGTMYGTDAPIAGTRYLNFTNPRIFSGWAIGSVYRWGAVTAAGEADEDITDTVMAGFVADRHWLNGVAGLSGVGFFGDGGLPATVATTNVQGFYRENLTNISFTALVAPANALWAWQVVEGLPRVVRA